MKPGSERNGAYLKGATQSIHNLCHKSWQSPGFFVIPAQALTHPQPSKSQNNFLRSKINNRWQARRCPVQCIRVLTNRDSHHHGQNIFCVIRCLDRPRPGCSGRRCPASRRGQQYRQAANNPLPEAGTATGAGARARHTGSLRCQLFQQLSRRKPLSISRQDLLQPGDGFL